MHLSLTLSPLLYVLSFVSTPWVISYLSPPELLLVLVTTCQHIYIYIDRYINVCILPRTHFILNQPTIHVYVFHSLAGQSV